MKWMSWLVPFLIFANACGQNDDASAPAFNEDAENEGLAFDEIVEPPQEYYDAALLDNMSRLHLAGETQGTPVLFIDFDGANLAKGYQRGQSFILCSRQATVPASGFSPAEQEQILQRVQEFFDRAGTNLQIVMEQPANLPYTTMIVGGSYGDLGCIDRRSVLGVAPLDRGNSNKNDIGFVFTRYISSIRVTSETIAHEAGHSFGLDHIRERNGLMYASNSSAIEGFINGSVGLGRPQNAPAILQADVGKAVPGQTPDPVETLPAPSTPPDISPTPAPNQPTPGLPGGIPGLDQIGGIGDLLGGLNPGQIGGGFDLDAILGGAGGLFPGLGNGQFPDLGSIGGLGGIDDLLGLIGLAGQVPNGTNLPGGLGPVGDITDLLGGFNSPNLGGLDDLIGLIPGAGQGGGLDLGSLLGDLSGIFNGGGLPGGVPGFPLQGGGGTLPDLSSILGLGAIQDLPTLFKTMDQHASFVNQNYTGHERETLLTALKVGYAQAYAGLK